MFAAFNAAHEMMPMPSCADFFTEVYYVVDTVSVVASMFFAFSVASLTCR